MCRDLLVDTSTVDSIAANTLKGMLQSKLIEIRIQRDDVLRNTHATESKKVTVHIDESPLIRYPIHVFPEFYTTNKRAYVVR